MFWDELPLERHLLVDISLVMIGLGVLTFLALVCGFRAMYGRYTVACLITVPSGWDWFLQELPSFIFAFCYIWSCETLAGFVVLGLYLIHYTNRALIYPWMITSKKGSPIYIFLMAVGFCAVNGYLQSAYHSQYYHYDDFFSSPSTYFGVIMFFTGMYINIQADSILRNLRKPNETGYKIPYGGMFEYVSGANFFGEIVEWAGFAMTAWSLPAFAFFIFTFCNIGPRASQHHRDYENRFKEKYPRNRKALIPFIY